MSERPRDWEMGCGAFKEANPDEYLGDHICNLTYGHDGTHECSCETEWSGPQPVSSES